MNHFRRIMKCLYLFFIQKARQIISRLMLSSRNLSEFESNILNNPLSYALR